MKFEYYQDKEGNAYELKTDLEQLLVHDMSEQGEEIERLNNIINELEKWLLEEQVNSVDLDEWTIIQVRDKIEELKGSVNNDN